MLVPTEKWANDLRDELLKSEMQVQWRTEGRVDNLRPEFIPTLAQAGLTILDLGLESASPLQLTRMNKTRAPQKYLDRAAKLMDACAANGIKVKANILLYAGETSETVHQTISWLDKHKDSIFGVSVGPVIAYGWPDEVKTYLEELKPLGASPAKTPCIGVTELNLSSEFTHGFAQQIAQMITQRYMNHENYYFLKSFSYFARDYRYSDFLSDLGTTISGANSEPSPKCNDLKPLKDATQPILDFEFIQ
ncbi:radical SAM protein [Deefgea tanakiae]|uniref:Radical SAM protein n=1 Tax=Deefgea tanakiae TaxID=2865840 RepID=A0ABX8Z8A8_9NEIS|nr:radical SAM protein [Deefgea tanakiae]QZA78655.1 radical SAM protein [Deefgea tanakiae]